MSERCGNCGAGFKRLALPNSAGWITGCPKCLDSPEAQQALRDLVAAKAEFKALASPPPAQGA